MKTLKTVLFYILSFTWGILMSAIGMLISLVLIICRQKPKLFYSRIYFEIGKDWGGVNFGPVFIMCKNGTLPTKQHECGHGIQNIIFGPLMPLIICIPSAVRYWLFRAAYKNRVDIFCTVMLVLNLIATAAFVLVMNIMPALSIIILVAILTLYICIIFMWSVFFESPKFDVRPMPEYNSIWFESTASKLGEKYFKEEK